jgi:hypothetical protein
LRFENSSFLAILLSNLLASNSEFLTSFACHRICPAFQIWFQNTLSLRLARQCALLFCPFFGQAISQILQRHHMPFSFVSPAYFPVKMSKKFTALLLLAIHLLILLPM